MCTKMPGVERWRGKVVLVTGASTGIGQTIAETLARSGMKVVACARRPEEIEKWTVQLPLDANDVTAIKCDLLMEEEILAMFKEIEQKFGHVDILVNNAGTAAEGYLIDGGTSAWQQMLNLNVLAGTICTREVLRLMKQNNVDDGHIININSTSGHNLVAGDSRTHFYEGSKHMVTALTKALNAELRQQKSKIRVTSLSPGLVGTPFIRNYPPLAALPFVEPLDIANGVLYVLGAPSHVNIRELTIAPTEQPWL